MPSGDGLSKTERRRIAKAAKKERARQAKNAGSHGRVVEELEEDDGGEEDEGAYQGAERTS